MAAFHSQMRRAAALLSLVALAAACAGPGAGQAAFGNAAACLRPSVDEGTASLAALVDRADLIALVTVTRVEALATSVPAGQARDLVFSAYDGDGRRVTLRTLQAVKGGVPAELVVTDAPCQMLRATPGESFVALLEGPPLADGTYRPVGLPVSALRARPDRTLDDLVARLRSIRPLDGDARALFERHGWAVGAKQAADEFDLPLAAEFPFAGREIRAFGVRLVEPFARYSELSAAAGLDPRPHAGKPAELLTFFLESKRDGATPASILGHALIAERRIVGAWVSLAPEGGAFAVTERATVLAAPVASPDPRRIPANRVPQGINVAMAYDLASARSISFKTGGGKAGEITDPATIRAFAAALDQRVATTQLVWDRLDQPPTRYFFHVDFPARTLSLQYDSATAQLSVYLDGFAARAPDAFVALVAALP